MLKLKINGKQYEIPQSFNEMTMKQYCNIFHNIDDVSKIEDERERFIAMKRNENVVLSRILGEDDDFCLDMPLPLFDLLERETMFIYSIDDFKRKNELVINGRKYKVPKANELSLRQWIDIDMISQEKDNRNKYIEVLSVLLNEIDDEGSLIPYKGDYEKLSNEISNMPCSEGLGIVYHFFWRGENLKKVSEACLKVEELNRLVSNMVSS